MQHVKRCLGVFSRVGVNPPIAISLTLLGIKGFRIQASQYSDPSLPIRQQDAFSSQKLCFSNLMSLYQSY